MRAVAVSLLMLVLLAAPSCQMNERLSGTLMGGVGGAVVGGLASGVGGAVIGGVAGAVAGYLVGDYLADQRERGRGKVFGSASDPMSVAAESASTRAGRLAYENGRAARTAPEAKHWYEESLRLNPDRPEPLNMLALGALHGGDPVQARQYLTQALAIDPLYKPAQHNLLRLDREHTSR